MSLIESIEPFNPNKDDFQSYMDRMEQYFIVNTVEQEMNVPLFITLVGGETYNILKNLLYPDTPSAEQQTKVVNQEVTVNTVTKWNGHKEGNSEKTKWNKKQEKHYKPCCRCGRRHEEKKCPAKHWQCFACKKKGHIAHSKLCKVNCVEDSLPSTCELSNSDSEEEIANYMKEVYHCKSRQGRLDQGPVTIKLLVQDKKKVDAINNGMSGQTKPTFAQITASKSNIEMINKSKCKTYIYPKEYTAAATSEDTKKILTSVGPQLLKIKPDRVIKVKNKGVLIESFDREITKLTNNKDLSRLGLEVRLPEKVWSPFIFNNVPSSLSEIEF
ncbi:hypothetical protein ILUMI_18273 [Ignelater luminosus]|uniref:Uncharacterized protein n=1 Tax=Ignelater luminosus TaxID=2038154 RepID=A0A8K0CK73_IGNLU|nr:hypothetical protein ILUMI_18273 [Ignelater luminosus]